MIDRTSPLATKILTVVRADMPLLTLIWMHYQGDDTPVSGDALRTQR